MRKNAIAVFILFVAALGASWAQAADVFINEIDADTPGTDLLEFVELYGTPNDPLDGKVLVFYNGNGDLSYAAYDLDGFSLDANGYFLLGNVGVVPAPTITFASNGLQNGADAVALYADDGATFPNGTLVTAVNLLDAIVYDTSDADDAGLLAVLTPGQPQVDENANGNKDNESLQRSPDGAGGLLNTSQFFALVPTPGAANGSTVLQPPMVSDVYHRSLLPEPAEAVTVFGDATDSDGTVTGVTVNWRINAGAVSSAAMTLSAGTTYTGTIPGAADGDLVEYYVEATDNDAQTTVNPSVGFYSYTVAPESITTIASIHADQLTYEGTVVMVQAQVYIPGDYKADGTSVSAFVQDTSGRGMNIFGTTRSTGMTLLNDTTNLVKVTGTAVWFNTTVELVNYEVELVSTGNPVLSPTVLSTLAAAASTNEGTYISSLGPITFIEATLGTNPAHNFTVNDGSGPVVFRVDDDLAPGLETWILGDELVASGAGATFNLQGQIIVGLASGIVNNGQGPDTTPPTLTSATLGVPTSVMLQFSEPLDAVTANLAANYEVYETATPANTVTVTAATLQPDVTMVELTLATGISGTAHTVRINNVEDLAGNPIAANTTAGIFDPGPAADIVINEIMQNPLALADSDGEWFEVYNAGAVAVDMNGWIIQDLGTNAHIIDNGGPLVINPGEYQVFGINATAMALEGVTLFYQYSNTFLGNADDELILVDTLDRVVDSVAWDDGLAFPDPNGASMYWTSTGDNADGTTWSITVGTFGSGDGGTPGAFNSYVAGVPELRADALGANYPNPFNPVTKFSFSLMRDDHVTLRVYDISGRTVRTILDGALPAGVYNDVYSWDGRDDAGRGVTSGMYFYRLTTASGFDETGKMTLLK